MSNQNSETKMVVEKGEIIDQRHKEMEIRTQIKILNYSLSFQSRELLKRIKTLSNQSTKDKLIKKLRSVSCDSIK